MKLLLVLVVAAVASARFVPISQYGTPEDRIEGEYVVKFEDDAIQEWEKFKMMRSDFMASRVSMYEFGDFKGFGGPLTQAELEIVQEMPGVESIEQNMIFRAIRDNLEPAASDEVGLDGMEQIFYEGYGQQNNVQAWGIDRSDQQNLPLNRIYRWRDNGNGSGTEVFVLDTGIHTGHSNFQGRARFVADCTLGGQCQTGRDPGDPQGHGTHCAGTVVSQLYGIAKNARVGSIRVLGANGSGSTAGIVNGINYVNRLQGKRIISMSLGGGFSTALNNAANASHRNGVINVVAAGNDGGDACRNSPASAESAVTVGASDQNDSKASFSSFGRCLNIWAPGVGVLSTSNNGGTATLSGTSMACPHVAGAVALIHSRGNFSADQVVATLRNEATSGKIRNPGAGSPNLLMFTSPN